MELDQTKVLNILLATAQSIKMRLTVRTESALKKVLVSYRTIDAKAGCS